MPCHALHAASLSSIVVCCSYGILLIRLYTPKPEPGFLDWLVDDEDDQGRTKKEQWVDAVRKGRRPNALYEPKCAICLTPFIEKLITDCMDMRPDSRPSFAGNAQSMLLSAVSHRCRYCCHADALGLTRLCAATTATPALKRPLSLLMHRCDAPL